MVIDEQIKSLQNRAYDIGAELRSLADRLSSIRAEWAQIEAVLGELPMPVDQAPARPEPPRGKYRALGDWLLSQAPEGVPVRFEEVEAVLGIPLPASARKQVAAWYGVQGSSLARAIHNVGYRARAVDLVGQTVEFHPVGSPDGKSST